MTAQSLSNCLWAVARLEMRGCEVEVFTQRCVHAVCVAESPDIKEFSPQGLTNTLWAIAKMSGGFTSEEINVHSLCSSVILEARPRLAEFQPQELSMLAWAVAKMRGRGPSAGRGRGGGHVSPLHGRFGDAVSLAEDFLVELAEMAHRRLPELAPQGVSNIAWALATANLYSRHSNCQAGGPVGFLLAAATAAEQALAEYPPQAVANLLWAVARLPGGASSGEASQVASRFAAAAAREATTRIEEFGWQDLSGILVALGQGRYRSPAADCLVVAVVDRAASCARKLTMQVLLNVALSAARLGVPIWCLQPLVDEIASEVQSRPQKLNSMDLRQWAEVQQACRRLATFGGLASPGSPNSCHSPSRHNAASSVSPLGSPKRGHRAAARAAPRVRIGEGSF